MGDRRVRWAELQPHEFLARQSKLPLVFLPMGLCEPHGQGVAFGLDTIKADYLCDEAARRFGGIVAPSMGYHIHESGIALNWLEEVVGDVNPLLGGLPPEVILQTFLYQLRAFANAGFGTVVGISGHNFGQQDLQLVAEEFMRDVPIEVVVRSDPELVAGTFEGDHAGRYELSQLLYLRPDLVNLARARESTDRQLGRFALGSDAGEATEGYGRRIIELSLQAIEEICRNAGGSKPRPRHRLSYADCERIWTRVRARKSQWQTLSR